MLAIGQCCACVVCFGGTFLVLRVWCWIILRKRQHQSYTALCETRGMIRNPNVSDIIIKLQRKKEGPKCYIRSFPSPRSKGRTNASVGQSSSLISSNPLPTITDSWINIGRFCGGPRKKQKGTDQHGSSILGVSVLISTIGIGSARSVSRPGGNKGETELSSNKWLYDRNSYDRNQGNPLI